MRGEARGEAFHNLANGIKLAKLVIIQRGDDSAFPGFMLDNALRFQPSHGFPHRRAADAESCGQFSLQQARTRRIIAAINGRENAMIKIPVVCFRRHEWPLSGGNPCLRQRLRASRDLTGEDKPVEN